MKQFLLRLIVFIVIISLISLFSLRFFATDTWKREVWLSMNTFFEMQLPRAYFDSEIENEVKNILMDVKKTFSAYYGDSELNKINNKAYHEPIKPSPELYEVLLLAIDFFHMSDGLFDITFQPLQDAYGFHDGRLRIPNEKELEEILSQIGSEHIIINHENRTIQFGLPHMKLNLSGLIKGYALDQVGLYLESKEIPYYILNFGGELRIKAPESVQVQIQHPRKNKMAGSIELVAGCISTSSDNNQFFIRNEKRYSHIINPVTGSAINNLYSATIVHPSSALIADILSTTIVLMEKDQAITWIGKNFPQVQWVMIDETGYYEWLNP